MSLISENREQLIDFLLNTEDELYCVAKIVYHIRDAVKVNCPTLSPIIDSELLRAYQLLDYASEQLYNHNTKLKLTYEE